MKGPNINPCGTAPKRECHTDMQGTFSHLTYRLKDTLHADCVRCKSAILYFCLPLHQNLYISSDKHVTRNGKWCPLLAELSGFRVWHALFLGGGVFLYLCLREQSIKGDEMTRGQKEKVWWWLAQKRRKSKKQLRYAKTEHRRRLVRFCNTMSQNTSVYTVFLHPLCINCGLHPFYATYQYSMCIVLCSMSAWQLAQFHFKSVDKFCCMSTLLIFWTILGI